MPLFEMTREDLVECKPVTFTHLEIKERAGLRHVLRDHIEVPGYPDPSGPGSPPRSAGGAVTAAPAGRAARWVAAGAALTTLAALGWRWHTSSR